MGTRLSEETALKPKPLVEIGEMPILWHVMKIYSAHGVNDFYICCGYKGHLIKEYFQNYRLYRSDVTFDIGNGTAEVHQHTAEPWRVTLLDTGGETQTGGRLRRIRSHLESEEAFFFTYGDGIGDVDITATLDFHRSHSGLATTTAVQPRGRYGALKLDGEKIVDFEEKPGGDGSWVSGGFFVLSPQIFDYIEGDQTVWEHEPLERLAREGQLFAYRHRGFWHSMDSLRDKTELSNLWHSGKAPWKVW